MVRENIACAALFKHINDKMAKGANERLGIHGITYMQMQMLLEMKHMGAEAVPLKSLERHFEVAQSTAAGIIVRLERKRLVSSFVPAEDKRQKYIRLTEEGKALCAAAESDMQEGEKLLLSGLSQEEQEQLYHLLWKVKDTMK
ncbi:MAG: winged helix DNA-binding protein [Clostridiales bacterium]|nr:winged helix DNA-binding protein [Clostridiales bacterium]